jgi:hypothetical protein
MKKMVLISLLFLAIIALAPAVSATVVVRPTPTPTPTAALIVDRPVHVVTVTTAITTAVPTGAITINSIPSGAQMNIDGTVQGTTPFTIRTLTAGSHTLLLTKEGYQDYPASFTITADQLNQQTYTLIPLTTAVPTTLVPFSIPTTVTTMLTTTSLPVTQQTPLPVQTTPAPTRQVPGYSLITQMNVCHYDSAASQCAGICPQTGKTCVQVNESTCGDATGQGAVKCGCVNTTSPVSLSAAGLVRAAVVSKTEYRPLYATQKGPVESVIQLITGIVKKKQALNLTDPRAYTMETTQGLAVHAKGTCPADLFRTTLVYADSNSAFISTDTGSQKGTFSWDSADPRVRTAVWQVSVFPFKAGGSNWSAVPGLLAQGNLDGDQHTFTIDFSKSVPTAGDAATVWGDKGAFLKVEKNLLTTVKTGLLTGSSEAPGANKTASSAIRQKQAVSVDNALLTINDKIAKPASYTVFAPSKTGSPVSLNTQLAGSAAMGAKASDALSGKYTAKAGVLAPVLNVPALTKEGIAGSLPQSQRTLFVRVVPFDQNGNYTNNPSNTKEVIVGEPWFNTTSPWSGWSAQSAPDQSGFANQPEMVSFGDRLYLFGVRSDNLVSMSSIDNNGVSTGWVPVPGSPQAGKSISAVVFEREAALGSSPEPHLYLFATRQDTGLTWYTRMDSTGTWSAWTQVPQKDATQTYELKKALSLKGNLYLLAGFNYRKYHPNDMSYEHVATSYVYQRMNEMGDTIGNLQWMNDWVDTGAATGSSNRIASAGDSYIVDTYQESSGQPHFIVYASPSSQKSCTSCTPSVTMTEITKIDVPQEILEAKTGTEDLTAASYHGRLYFFVRGKAGHIYMASETILNQLGSTQYLGSLHGWEDISPDQQAAGSGIAALSSPEGDRLDVLANNIQKAGTGGSGWMGSLFTSLFAAQSTGMQRNSLGGAPENTQLLSSFNGDKDKASGDILLTGYRSMDINVSWTRTTPFWFAWNSSRPGLYYAEWQVSATPFDEVHPVFNDKGIVSRGRLDVSTTDPDLATYGTGNFINNALPGYVGKVHLFPVNFHDFATAADPANPSVTPYYIRVIAVAPTDSPGSFTAYVSEQTEVDWGPQYVYVPKFCTPPTYYTYEYPLPKVRIIGYTQINKQDPNYQCYTVVTTGHTWWKNYFLGSGMSDPEAEKWATAMVGNVEVGWTKYLCDPPADKSWWDKLMGGFEDLFSLIASLVDNIANAYNSVKAVVISSFCGGNSACITVMSTGVDIGLAALGVPPTLPNFDQLMNEGADYLAATVADESGVPVDAVAPMIHQVADSMKNVPSPSDPYGLQPNPQYQYQPARLLIELRNDDPVNTTPPGSIRFEDGSGLFKTTQPDTPFPSLGPGKSVTFPLILKEDQWKGMSCTECLEDECYSVSCDEAYYGEISNEWWSRYQNAADFGDSFSLYYTGMSPKFTSNITNQMEAKYGVQLNTYAAKGPMDYQKPDCMAEKHGLIFQPTDNSGNALPYYYYDTPLSRVSVDSLVQDWNA